MIIPVGDVGKTRTVAWVNWFLILANCAIFAWYGFRQDRYDTTISTYGMVPNQWENWKTLFTSMFLHGNVEHLLGNMLFLYIVGDNVEDRLGHFAYLVFYLLAGLAGGAAHILYSLHFAGGSDVHTVGASGAISGVMGAYLIFFPGSQIKFMIWLLIFVRYFTLPAWGVIGFWVASQILMARNQFHGVAEKEAAMVAVFAHLGGFLFGMVVATFARLFNFGNKPSKRHHD